MDAPVEIQLPLSLDDDSIYMHITLYYAILFILAPYTLMYCLMS